MTTLFELYPMAVYCICYGLNVFMLEMFQKCVC